MIPSYVIFLARARVRAYWRQDLLAAAGIAIGVALTFAVLVANGSIFESSDRIVRGIVGRADLQLMSRDGNGFDEAAIREVRELPAVSSAGLLLDQRATIVGPRGEQGVNLASIDESMADMSEFGGGLVTDALKILRGVLLTSSAADAVGVGPGVERTVQLEVRGLSAPLPVAARLGRETIGPLSAAPIAVMPLRMLQDLTGLHGRVTRILVDARPGEVRQAREQLAPIADRLHLSVTPAMEETRLLKQALGPSDWTTGFFAAIAAMLGFLLAFNAMLLTAPERRKSITQLRMLGYGRGQLTAVLLSQAVALGLVASIAGVGLGVVLAKTVFSADVGYLAPAFVPGSQVVFEAWPALVAIGGGTLACVAASAPPLLDLRQRSVSLVEHWGDEGQTLSARSRRRLPIVAAGSATAAVGLLAVRPGVALAACALLALATISATPAVFAGMLKLAGAICRIGHTPTLMLAVFALRATTIRSLALASTGALAVFGTIATIGARADLVRGIDNYTADYVSTADLWVVNPLDNQATNGIALPDAAEKIRAVPGVEDVRSYYGSFLDMDGRRVWVVARPADDPEMLPPSQIVKGSLAGATDAMRAGGTVAISTKLADALGVDVGDAVTLPTPTGPRQWRVGALTTNLGWTPGAVIMRADDYQQAWATGTPSAIEVDVTADANVVAVQRTITAALGPAAGLRVQTADARAAGIGQSAREGLRQLEQISALLLAGAVLAMATAMSAAIWQRRVSLAGLRIEGYRPRTLWRLLLVESSIILAAGCVTGTICGVVGQVGVDAYLTEVTGFPVQTVPWSWQTFETFALVLGVALLVVAFPGWRASRVPPQVGLSPQ